MKASYFFGDRTQYNKARNTLIKEIRTAKNMLKYYQLTTQHQCGEACNSSRTRKHQSLTRTTPYKRPEHFLLQV